MVSKYTVAQYFPDPVTDERVNIGVLVFDEKGAILARFLKNWRRVSLFGEENIEFLKEFAEGIEVSLQQQKQLPGLESSREINQATLNNMIGRWMNSIQFTEPHASIQEPKKLLNSVAKRFLKESKQKRRHARTRLSAIALAANSLKETLELQREHLSKELLRKDFPVEGKHEEHRADIALTNGKLFRIAQGLSFEINESRRLDRRIDATAWLIDDLRQAHKEIPLDVIVFPPEKESKSYSRAKRVFESLGASVVPEDKVGAWALKAAKEVLT